MRFLFRRDRFRRDRLPQELHELRGAIAQLEREIEKTEEAVGETSEATASDAYSPVQRLRDAMVREELRRKRTELEQMLEREARLQRRVGKPYGSAAAQPAVAPEAGLEPPPLEQEAYPEAVSDGPPEVPAASYEVARSYDQAPPVPEEEAAYAGVVAEETPEVLAASYEVAQSHEQPPAELAEQAAYAGAGPDQALEVSAASYEVAQSYEQPPTEEPPYAPAAQEETYAAPAESDEQASTYEPASPAQAPELPPAVEPPHPLDGGGADLVEVGPSIEYPREAPAAAAGDEEEQEDGVDEEKGGLGIRQLIVAGAIVGIIAIGLIGRFLSGSVGQSDDSAPGLLPTTALPAAALASPPPPAVPATAAPTVAPAALSPGAAMPVRDVPPQESADTAPAEPASGAAEPEPQPQRTEQPVVRVGTVRVPGFNAAVVRAAPSLSSRVVTSVVNGGRVLLLEGSASGDGLRWVRVQAPDGNTGWMAATLLEVSEVQASAPAPRPAAPPPFEGQTNLGSATVAAPAGVRSANARALPGQSSQALASLPNGTHLEVLEGTARGDGFLWLRIRAPNGTVG